MEALIEKIICENSGVTLVTLEEELKISRLRLAYVIKKLIDEEKIIKINNKFYSLNQNENYEN
jgi:hypothetical protein